MDNDDAPIGLIYSRREAMILAAKSGLAFSAAGLLSTASAQQSQKVINLVASPALTEGPFFVDSMLDRSDLLSGTNRAAVLTGIPLEVELSIFKLVGTEKIPFKKCQVDVWHCDAKGVYSGVSDPMNSEDTKDQSWLRGHQTTNAAGLVTFQTIVPGWYPGRTAHIHFKLRTYSEKHKVTADFTSQLFFEEAFLKRIYAKPPYSGRSAPAEFNKRDGIFGERQVDGTMAGSHLTVDLSTRKGKDVAKFAILLTDRNFRTEDLLGVDGPLNWDQF